MKNQQIKVALFVSLMSITAASDATNNGSKQRPPAEQSNDTSTPPPPPPPTPAQTPSFWDWIQQYFVF